jgi:YD repeat-containing protein
LEYASRPHLPGDATQGATTQTYDARWRLRRRTFSDATYIELGDGMVGNLNAGAEVGEIAASGTRDQRGNWTYAFTDFRGSTLRTIDELGHATRYRYDAFGTLALIADYRANLTRIRTDKLGRVLEHEDADTGIQEYAYTAFDELFTHIDGPEDALRVRKHSYDELGRLTTVNAPEGPTYFSYDGPGDNAAGVRGRIDIVELCKTDVVRILRDFQADIAICDQRSRKRRT